jgi:hypothetical protein
MTWSQLAHLLIWPLLFAVIAGVASYRAGLITKEANFTRFMERGTDDTSDSLKAWIKTNPDAAQTYRRPVLVPLDLIFLFAAGIALGMGSFRLAGAHHLLASSAPLFLILPVIYIVADFSEDMLLYHLLSAEEAVTPNLVGVTHALTKAKIWSFTAASGQMIVAFVMVLMNLLRPG